MTTSEARSVTEERLCGYLTPEFSCGRFAQRGAGQVAISVSVQDFNRDDFLRPRARQLQRVLAGAYLGSPLLV